MAKKNETPSVAIVFDAADVHRNVGRGNDDLEDYKLVGGSYVKGLDGFDRTVSEMPLGDLLRGWRNDADDLLRALAIGDDPATVMMFRSRLLLFAAASLAVMRRGAELGVPTPMLADLRATMDDLRATNPALSVPALFLDWEKAAPTILPRLRDAIRLARAEVDAIECAVAMPSSVAQDAPPKEGKPTKAQTEKSERMAKLRKLMKDKAWCAKGQKEQARELEIEPRTLRDYMREINAK